MIWPRSGTSTPAREALVARRLLRRMWPVALRLGGGCVCGCGIVLLGVGGLAAVVLGVGTLLITASRGVSASYRFEPLHLLVVGPLIGLLGLGLVAIVAIIARRL